MRVARRRGLAAARWSVGRNLADDEWAWILGHIRRISPLGHDIRRPVWKIHPHDLPLSDWLLAHDIRVLMIVALQPLLFRFSLLTLHRPQYLKPWLLSGRREEPGSKPEQHRRFVAGRHSYRLARSSS